MKGTHQSHSQNLGAVETDSSAEEHDLYENLFGQKGWALPKRSDFRYSNKQKVLLYKYFIDGEKSRKKKSPDEVHLLLRKDLSPQEYVTSQQIRSLFSRWSKQYREGTLIPLHLRNRLVSLMKLPPMIQIQIWRTMMISMTAQSTKQISVNWPQK